MNIKPNTSIRQNDFGQTGINSHTKHEEMLKLRAELMAVEENRSHGESDYFVDEVVFRWNKLFGKYVIVGPKIKYNILQAQTEMSALFLSQRS